MFNQYVLTDAVVYLDNNCTLGVAKKVTTPKITPGSITRKTLAGVGEETLNNCKVTVGELQLTLNSFIPEIFATIADPCSAISLKIFANAMEFADGTPTGNKAIELYIRGTSKEFETLGEINEHDDVDYPMTFACNKVRLVADNKELYNIDISNHQYIVNGVDIRKEIVKNLGLT